MDWYPDPADPARERYWDGQQWTHNTRAPRVVVAPAAPLAQPGAESAVQYQWQQQRQQPWPGGAQPGPSAGPGVALGRWWQRVASHLVDSVVVSFLLGLFAGGYSERFTLAYSKFMQDYLEAAEAGTTLPSIGDYDLVGPGTVVMAVQALVTFAYVAAMLRYRGATIGKLLMGLRVVPEDAAPTSQLSWGQAMVRAGVFVLCLMTSLPFLVSALMPLWTKRRQTLHDMAAHTVVVKTR